MKRGQSVLEYTVLIGTVVAALMIMHVYIKRTYQGRLKQNADEVGQQYSPGHTSSLVVTNTSSTATTCTGGKCWDKDIPEGMTVTKSSTNTTMTKKEGVDSFVED